MIPAIAALFLLGLLCKVGLWSYEYYKLQAGFHENDRPSSHDKQHTDYLSRVPMEEMDFFQYVRYLNRPVAGAEYTTAYAAPFSIRYYKEDGGRKVLAHEIPAGSTLETKPSGAYPLGYGFESFPTYEKGWRWARPFSDDKNVIVSEMPWYYVKTADLEALAKYMVQNSSHWQHFFQISGLSESELVYGIVRKCDLIFYERGICISPDLSPNFWTWDCILLASGLLAFSGYLLLSKVKGIHSKSKKPNQETPNL